jgi:hypothetical protein
MLFSQSTFWNTWFSAKPTLATYRDASLSIFHLELVLFVMNMHKLDFFALLNKKSTFTYGKKVPDGLINAGEHFFLSFFFSLVDNVEH